MRMLPLFTFIYRSTGITVALMPAQPRAMAECHVVNVWRACPKCDEEPVKKMARTSPAAPSSVRNSRRPLTDKQLVSSRKLKAADANSELRMGIRSKNAMFIGRSCVVPYDFRPRMVVYYQQSIRKSYVFFVFLCKYKKKA